MASVGDVFQLIDEQVLAGQQVLNVYFYKLATPVVGNAAQMCVASWIDQVLPTITNVQTNDILHRSVSAKNIFNETEQHTELISETGDDAGSVWAPFNAVAVRLIGDNAAVRDGQKRIGGLGDNSQSDGVITDTSTLTNLAAMALMFASGLPIGLDIDALLPVVVGRILDGGSYRLPANAGEAVLSNVIDSLFNVDISSQTSRKIGRGA